MMAEPERSSIYVAPLLIHKVKPADSDIISVPNSATSQLQRSHQMTPPLTPQCFVKPTDVPDVQEQALQPQFNNYLRAFYHFHPTCDESSSTIQLPLNPGDLVLVHSIHTNGWADGTMLSSGARGWLPTNYCSAYDNKPMHNLLKALTTLWDLMHTGPDRTTYTFPTSGYMRSLVAGVRCLLVRVPIYR